MEFLHYLHWNPTTMGEAMSALVDPEIFKLSDLVKMNAAAVRPKSGIVQQVL